MEIEYLYLKRKYKYFWIKYVNAVDLTIHCAKCLIGSYSKIKNYDNALLNESEYKYIYICGVSIPFVYNDNIHIALKYKKDSIVKIDNDLISICVKNAEEIKIVPAISNEKRQNYVTCRNWQFANMIKESLNGK